MLCTVSGGFENGSSVTLTDSSLLPPVGRDCGEGSGYIGGKIMVFSFLGGTTRMMMTLEVSVAP